MRDNLIGYGIEFVDVVLDVVGSDIFGAAIRCLRPGGRVVVVGFASGRIAVPKTNYLLLKEIGVIGLSLEKVLDRRAPVLHDLMGKIYGEIAAGRFDPIVMAMYPMSKFHRASSRPRHSCCG